MQRLSHSEFSASKIYFNHASTANWALATLRKVQFLQYLFAFDIGFQVY